MSHIGKSKVLLLQPQPFFYPFAQCVQKARNLVLSRGDQESIYLERVNREE